ncbi:MAG: hypothetical protein ACP5ON_11585 [Bacteroidota bacterium]
MKDEDFCESLLVGTTQVRLLFVLFAFLSVVNLRVVFNQYPTKENWGLQGLAMRLFVPTATAYTGPGGGGGAGGSTYGSWVTVGTNIWTCYKLNFVQEGGFGVYCYSEYQQCVETQECHDVGGAECLLNAGLWRWVPNTPCSPDYQTPPAALPCN